MILPAAQSRVMYRVVLSLWSIEPDLAQYLPECPWNRAMAQFASPELLHGNLLKSFVSKSSVASEIAPAPALPTRHSRHMNVVAQRTMLVRKLIPLLSTAATLSEAKSPHSGKSYKNIIANLKALS